VGPERGRILVELVRRVKPRRVLEVGALVGYSTILIARELESQAEIVSIEIDEDEVKTAKENIRRAKLKPKIDVLVGDALGIIPNLGGKFDLVFLDAAKNEYLDYLRLLDGDLHKGSVIVADNAGIFAKSMRRYLDYVRNSGKYESSFIPVDWDGIEVSIRL